MCGYSIITRITSILCYIVVFAIPIIYLIMCFSNKKVKKKFRRKAMLYAIIFLIVLLGIKNVFRLNIDGFKCINCIVNYRCENKSNESDYVNKETNDTTKINETSTTSITTSTTTSTTQTTEKKTSTTTTTTTKKSSNNEEYKNVKEISGERKDVGKTSKGYTIYTINGITYIDGYLIANKTYNLPESYVPENTYTNAKTHGDQQCASCIEKDAYKAWKDMKADAAALNLNIYISSGYRSYKVQKNIYNRNVKKNGQAKADTYSARPGSSEHQTGLCFDLNTITSSFQYTDEGKWVNENAYKYGYIIRYPKNKSDKTGYMFEPWHLRYVGTKLAKELYNNGNWLTIEEYFGITSEYKD